MIFMEGVLIIFDICSAGATHVPPSPQVLDSSSKRKRSLPNSIPSSQTSKRPTFMT